MKDHERLMTEHTALPTAGLAKELAQTLKRRALLLKLMSMNNFDMEANSSDERLAEFKVTYGASIKALDRCLYHFCPSMTAQEHQDSVYAFLPSVYGIYPYTAITDNQDKTMKNADVLFVRYTIYDLVINCVLQLICDEKKEG